MARAAEARIQVQAASPLVRPATIADLTRILNSRRGIKVERIIRAFETHSQASSEPEHLNETAIHWAYGFMRNSFAHAEVPPRKDNTPAPSHSERVGAMAAHFGHMDLLIAALLHDVVEDCGIHIDQITTEFGPQVAISVALLTKARLASINGAGEWIYPYPEFERWNNTTDLGGAGLFREHPELYEERMRRQFEIILDNDLPNVTPSMKATVFLVKMFDALDNLKTDKVFAREKAMVRAAILREQIRHLEILSPLVHSIMNKLLEKRGYPAKETTKFIRSIAPASRIMLVPPIEEFSASSLDRYPMPNTCIEICIDSDNIRSQLDAGTFAGQIRIHFPHEANSTRVVRELKVCLAQCGVTEAEVEIGKSLLPIAGEAASVVVEVSKIHTYTKVAQLQNALKRLHEELHLFEP